MPSLATSPAYERLLHEEVAQYYADNLICWRSRIAYANNSAKRCSWTQLDNFRRRFRLRDVVALSVAHHWYSEKPPERSPEVVCSQMHMAWRQNKECPNASRNYWGTAWSASRSSGWQRFEQLPEQSTACKPESESSKSMYHAAFLTLQGRLLQSSACHAPQSVVGSNQISRQEYPHWSVQVGMGGSHSLQRACVEIAR